MGSADSTNDKFCPPILHLNAYQEKETIQNLKTEYQSDNKHQITTLYTYTTRSSQNNVTLNYLKLAKIKGFPSSTGTVNKQKSHEDCNNKNQQHTPTGLLTT